jgi:hypothetical protein
MSDTVALSVKWGKETITLDFVVAGGVKGLKIEMEEKTRVSADRMKLMAKSKGKIMKPIGLHCYVYAVSLVSYNFCFQAYGRVF